MEPSTTETPRPELVAACGLYCGACRSFLKGSCPGCRENSKASWCKVRACNLERDTRTCAECTDHVDPVGCKKFDNAIARVVGFVFNSNRAACIGQIRALGLEGHAKALTEAGRMTIPRRGKHAPK